MHQLVRPLLYQTVHIDIADSRAENSRQKALFSFQKTLSENACLANLVQNLDVSWHGTQYPYEESSPGNRIIIQPDIEQSIDGILSCVSRLQTLALRRLSDGQLPTFYAPEVWRGPYACPLFSGNRLNNLREPRLTGMTIDIESTALAVQLPKLEVLGSQGLAHRFEVNPEKHTIQSILKRLSLGPLCKPGPDTRLILEWCGALETLSYDLGVYMGRRDMPDHPTLSQLLAPQINTLVELTLVRCDYTSIHMNSIDLKVFSKLKKVTIASKLLFPCYFPSCETQAAYRNGLYKRLPQSLESLKILFDRGISLLDPLYNPQCSFKVDENYGSIEQLGANKVEYLPKLRSIALIEHSSCDWGIGPTDPSMLREWEMPQSVKDAFEGKGVSVDILIRTEYILRAYLGPKFVFTASPRRETPLTF